MDPLTYNILHLTDLHFTNKGAAGREQREVIKALLNDIGLLIDEGLKPDIIIFNGDAVQNADEPSIFWSLTELLFEPLMQKCRVTADSVLIVPGNHDVMRSGAYKHAAVHREFMKSFNVNDIEKFFYEDVASDVQRDKMLNFSEFTDLASNYNFSDRYDYLIVDKPSLKTTFCLFNTAYSSAGGHPDILRDEYGKLLAVPTRLRLAADDAEASQGPLKIFIGHHPREWFKEDCGRPFERAVIRGFDLHFAGHVHIHDPNTISSHSGQLVRLQTGALYDHDVPWNGYSIVRVSPETKNLEIRPRRYIAEQTRFVSAVEFGENGSYFPSPEDRAFWRARPSVNRKAVAEWVEESLLPHFKRRHSDTLTGQSLQDVFHEHPMQTKLPDYESTDIPKEVGSDITFEQVCNSSENFTIIGETNYGKSTFIRRMALELMNNCASSDRLSIPALFDFNDIGLSGDGVLKAIRYAVPGIDSVVPIRQLLSEGLLTVIVDDVNPQDAKRFKQLMDFTEQFPRGRFVFTSHPVQGTGLPITAAFDRAVSFKEIALLTLRTRGIRAFAERHFTEMEPDSCDRLVRKIVSTLKQASLPPTAFSVSVLLAVITDLDNDVLINEVNLIERFVEYLLRKERTVEAARSTFNFGDKVRCLAFVAEKMARNGCYDVPLDELEEYVSSFIFEIGFPHDPKEILARFIEQKIFRPTEVGLYRFYLRSFLEYFLAQRMTFSREFYEFVMEEGRYLSFVNEIEFFCGLPANQNDHQTLNVIADRHDEIVRIGKKELLPMLPQLDNLELPSAADGKKLEEVTEQLSLPKLSMEERDERIDADMAINTTSQGAYRPDASDQDSKEFLSLTLYSSVLRNLEHLRREEKEAHLRNVLESWAIFMMKAFALIPNIVKHRSFKINGVTYRTFPAGAISDEKLTRMLMFYLPSGNSSLIRSYLGSEKLIRQLEFDVNGHEASILKIIRLFLLADLDTPDWVTVAGKLKKVFQGKTYLAGTLMWKLNTVIKLRDISPSKQTGVVEIIARLSAEESSKDPAVVSRNYSKRFVQLQNSLRVREMHKKAGAKAARASLQTDRRNVTDSSI